MLQLGASSSFSSSTLLPASMSTSILLPPAVGLTCRRMPGDRPRSWAYKRRASRDFGCARRLRLIATFGLCGGKGGAGGYVHGGGARLAAWRGAARRAHRTHAAGCRGLPPAPHARRERPDAPAARLRQRGEAAAAGPARGDGQSAVAVQPPHPHPSPLRDPGTPSQAASPRARRRPICQSPATAPLKDPRAPSHTVLRPSPTATTNKNKARRRYRSTRMRYTAQRISGNSSLSGGGDGGGRCAPGSHTSSTASPAAAACSRKCMSQMS
jgi:hypothetical protein